MHSHISMVGCVGAEQSAPVPFSRLRQPCTVHHQAIGVAGGDDSQRKRIILWPPKSQLKLFPRLPTTRSLS
ncbi:hypothetical protein DKN99_27730 [Escherichia coli]|nr:hypothetical protein [Escherichia coli]EFO4158447.1 hypothetical protein [Escherichia coli]EFO4188949.1 hypothetical protein [Escherichia coli]